MGSGKIAVKEPEYQNAGRERGGLSNARKMTYRPKVVVDIIQGTRVRREGIVSKVMVE